MKATVYRKAHFNAAHRLHNPKWSDERNKEVFGPCNNEHYHGHNYELIVSVKGEIDPETGYVIDLKYLSDVIDEKVIRLLDHRNLNVEVDAFRKLNPTVENIAAVIWQILRDALGQQFELKVRLYETPKNFVDFEGG